MSLEEGLLLCVLVCKSQNFIENFRDRLPLAHRLLLFFRRNHNLPPARRNLPLTNSWRRLWFFRQ